MWSPPAITPVRTWGGSGPMYPWASPKPNPDVDCHTISSPFIVAYMTETLNPQPTDKVLEIGCGVARIGRELAHLGKIGRRWQGVLDEDDVMQVTYLEAFLHIEQLVARDPASFVGWLTRIADNVLRDTLRELERQKRAPAAHSVLVGGASDSHIALLATLGHTSSTPSDHAARDEATHPRSSGSGRQPASA